MIVTKRENYDWNQQSDKDSSLILMEKNIGKYLYGILIIPKLSLE